MDTRLQNQIKAPSPSSVSPMQTSLFNSRPFAEPEQEEGEALGSSHQSSDLQTQLDRASRFGHDFSRVQVQPQTPAIIQPQLNFERSEEQDEQDAKETAEPVKLMASPLSRPIQREVQEEEPIQMMRWLQPKVVVGTPGDKYEQEADSVAAQVMSMKAPPANTGLVQPQAEEEQQEPLVQRTPLADSITPLVQRQSEEQEEAIQPKSLLQRAGAKSNSEVGSSLENKLTSSKGGGSPLPDNVRSFMEPRFGTDFSGVRVHTDSSAVQMNKELGAQAFAHGSDIYYGAGKSPGKDVLTAHELTHTIQQTGGVRLNKELRRQPQPEEQEKEQLQAKELGDRTSEVSSNKELRLQPLEEQEEQQPLQAQELGDRTPEISPNKELRLQPIEEQQEAEPVQAKQLGNFTPEVFLNKELRLQPIEEQEEAEPLQAKELPSHNPELSLNKELQRQPLETANPVIQAKALEGGFTPSPVSIQRGMGDWLSQGWNKTKDVVGAGIERGGDLLSKGKDLLKSGLDWVKNNIIQPLMQLASSGWSAVKNGSPGARVINFINKSVEIL